jgi:ribose transport system permease protein
MATINAAQTAAGGTEKRRLSLPRLAQGNIIQIFSLAAFLCVIGYFVLVARGFATPGNLENIAEQSTVLAILSFGMVIVIIGGGSDVIQGGIDLSLAANLGLSSAVFATVINAGGSDLVAVSLTLLTGVLIGVVNAFAVVVCGILPLLGTLAVMNICAGGELVLTQNSVVSVSSPLMNWLSGRGFGGISIFDYALLVASALLIVIIQYTPLGLRLYAVGGHREAARAAGLPAQLYITGSYLASGLCGAVAAILSVTRLSGSVPGSDDQLLSIVVAALLGVVLSRRLVPTISGALLSTLFIGCLINGFQLLGISSYWVNGVQGALILLVVALTSSIRRGT